MSSRSKLRGAISGFGEVAARAARLIRLATVWSVLTAGAVLLLAAAVIQLVLAYT